MWIQEAWTNAALVSRLVFVYDRNNRHSFDCAIRMNIRARDGGCGAWLAKAFAALPILLKLKTAIRYMEHGRRASDSILRL